MRRLLRHPRALCSALLGLLAALGGGGCAGTPLPEPPDLLPRPDIAGLNAEDAVLPANLPQTSVVVIPVAPRVVPDGATMLFINLDAPQVAIEQRSAPDAGGFSINLPAAVGDRVRTLFLTENSYSPPLDLVALPSETTPNQLPFELLGDTSLVCVQVTPGESLLLAGGRGHVEIVNGCDTPVDLTRAALRSGALGIRLAAPPGQLAPGARVALTLEDAQRDAPLRLDVLLLDVASADGRRGRYAIDIFANLR